jgi:hypothetical protein
MVVRARDEQVSSAIHVLAAIRRVSCTPQAHQAASMMGSVDVQLYKPLTQLQQFEHANFHDHAG